MKKELTVLFKNTEISEAQNFSSIKISIASPEKIKSWTLLPVLPGLIFFTLYRKMQIYLHYSLKKLPPGVISTKFLQIRNTLFSSIYLSICGFAL